MKTTLILGASDNPERYAYKAAAMLLQHGHAIAPVGIKKGAVFGQQIITDKTPLEGIDTITLYVGPQNQPEWQEYILATKPRRIIFNPGTENPVLAAAAQSQGIETEEACTLVLLSISRY